MFARGEIFWWSVQFVQSPGQTDQLLAASGIIEPHKVSGTAIVDVEFDRGVTDEHTSTERLIDQVRQGRTGTANTGVGKFDPWLIAYVADLDSERIVINGKRCVGDLGGNHERRHVVCDTMRGQHWAPIR